jgi:hypothetical protein
MRSFVYFSAFIFIAVLTGCKTTPKSPKPSALGTWKLESIACAGGSFTAAGRKRAADLNRSWEQYLNLEPASFGQALKIKIPQTAVESHCRVTVASKLTFKDPGEYEVTQTGFAFVMLDGPQDRRCRGIGKNTDVYSVKYELDGDSLTQSRTYEWFAGMKRNLWPMNATCNNGSIVEKYRRIPAAEYPIIK